ncbi:MAG: acetate--CoA ligase family protein [Deltaproteobacteria bacterium]|nr:acetate--CoA ligase family protein [Deltaproteobacteria bacterium]
MTGRTLSEHASKELLARYGVPVSREALAQDAAGAAAAAERLGFPVVVKLCGDAIAHKTERDLVRLGLANADAVRAAASELLAKARPDDGKVELLVAEMVRGKRELIAGLVRDPQFGPCVLLGLGGIAAEALSDVVFAAAPLTRAEARALVTKLRSANLYVKPWRGEPAVDLDALADVLVGLGKLGAERPDIASVDLNPVLIAHGKPVAVDALVEIADVQPAAAKPARALDESAIREKFARLFNPRGVVVAGVSSHPGKFGFVAYHNLLRFGYQGQLFPVNREGVDVLGMPTLSDVSQVPENAADLVFVCTQAQTNPELLKACRARGVRAAFIASAGYGEAGEEGKKAEADLVKLANDLGMVVAGPNGQGVISTEVSMCAQIVAPHPPRGHISVASQSGNLVSSFLNYSVESGIGVSKAISAGNSAQTTLADYVEYFGVDPDTAVVLAYLESVGDGRRFADVMRATSRRKPIVLVKGGAAAEGQRAAASHTGALASDDRVFDGVAKQAGVIRAPSVEHAFEWAASFATQPLPRGRRTIVFTTAGGWGVLAADACAASGLTLMPLPDDLKAKIDTVVPPRWSRNNPIDLAGGETRDTVAQVMDWIVAHPDVDAMIHLGIGIQAGQANAFRSGPYYPGHGIDRIVDYHVRQDRRYAAIAREVSEKYGKPVLTCSELVNTDRHYGNSGPVGVKEEGRVCYPSAHRAIAALAAMCEYAEWRRAQG